MTVQGETVERVIDFPWLRLARLPSLYVRSPLVDNKIAGLYVNLTSSAEFPFGDITTTFFAPTVKLFPVLTGDLIVIDVSLKTVKSVAATPSIVTPVADVKSVPVRVIGVPPAAVPDVGDIDVSEAAATAFAG